VKLGRKVFRRHGTISLGVGEWMAIQGAEENVMNVLKHVLCNACSWKFVTKADGVELPELKSHWRNINDVLKVGAFTEVF